MFSDFSFYYLLYNSYLNMPIKGRNVSRMYQGCQNSRKQCSFIVTGCPILEV